MCDTDLGQPIPLGISDQETREPVELFLQSIKSRSPFSAVSILMTDDGIIILLQFQFTHYREYLFRLQTILPGMQQLVYFDHHLGRHLRATGMFTGTQQF